MIPATATAPDPEQVAEQAALVVITANCWVCGGQLTKRVSRSNATSITHYWHWPCDECDVSWAAPGTVVA